MSTEVQTNLGPISKEQYDEYCKKKIGKIYKLLPLKEEHNPTLYSYINSLLVELYGSRKIIPRFASDPEFIMMICSIAGLESTDDLSVFRSKVFECIEVCKKLIKEE